jgi:hypothetical protein
LQKNPAKRLERFGIYLKNQRKGLIYIRFDIGVFVCVFYKSRDFLRAIVICFIRLGLIVTAGFEAGLKERLDLTYKRNTLSVRYLWMFRKTIIYKIGSTLFGEIVSGHKNIIHPYIRFGYRKVCKLPAIF